MAITTTTLRVAVANTSQTFIAVTSATGFVKGYLVLVDDELMAILGVEGTVIKVMRGVAGTVAKTHLNGAIAAAGLASDFGDLQPLKGMSNLTILTYSLTGTAGATATKGYLVVIADGTLRYIPLTDSVT